MKKRGGRAWLRRTICNPFEASRKQASAVEKAALADDTADYILSKLMSEDRSKKNPEAKAAKEELAYLRRGIGRLTFSDTDVAELTHAFDKTGFPYLGTPVPQGVTFQPPSGE